jgi:hypothetical protein
MIELTVGVRCDPLSVVLLLVLLAFLLAMVAVEDCGERYGDVPASEAVPAVGYRRRRTSGKRGFYPPPLVPKLIGPGLKGALVPVRAAGAWSTPSPGL